MGANQSHAGDNFTLYQGENSAIHRKSHHTSVYRQTGKRFKEKPSQPKKPIAVDASHNSITLSWSTPRSGASSSIIAYTIEMIPLRPHSDRQWALVTKCCQGTSYEVRHLDPDTAYIFRVRAENVHGVGKPSPPSDIITTRMFASAPYFPAETSMSMDTTDQCFKRRHSFSVHLDGRVTKLLNNSDMTLTPTALPTQNGDRTFNRNSVFRTSLQNNRKVSQSVILPGTGTNSIARLRESRSSLKTGQDGGQIKKKREVTRNKNRDSRDSSGSTISESNNSTISAESLKKAAELGSLNSLHSDVTISNCSKNMCADSVCNYSEIKDLCGYNSVDRKDKMCLLQHLHNQTAVSEATSLQSVTGFCNTLSSPERVVSDFQSIAPTPKNFEITVENLHIHDMLNEKFNSSINSFGNSQALRGYYDNLECPWEKNDLLDSVSQQATAVPFCDDSKLARLAHPNHNFDDSLNRDERDSIPAYLGCDESRDFRTLRSVLQSNNMIVRSSRSLPDVVGTVVKERADTMPHSKGRLTTIMDTEEEDDSVRITTL